MLFNGPCSCSGAGCTFAALGVSYLVALGEQRGQDSVPEMDELVLTFVASAFQACLRAHARAACLHVCVVCVFCLPFWRAHISAA